MDEIEGGTCYWANMPPELLREVLMKIEDSESSWPARKHVVACAAVCKSWREIIKELVKTLEVSGKITFPISIKQPGPRESLIQCFVKRNRATQMHYLYLSLSQALAGDGKFLLAARRFRRPAFTEHVISLHPDHMFRASGSYIGKLRSNFLGNKFVVYDALPPHAGAKILQTRSTQMVGLKQISPGVPTGNYPVAQIMYELNVLGARSPRRMHCIMDSTPASAIKPGGVAPIQVDFPFSNANSFPAIPFFWSKSNGLDKSLSAPLNSQREASLVLRNEAPRWNQQLHCWCLNFQGRVTVASVKNFQLVASPENGVVGAGNEKIFLQFGKYSWMIHIEWEVIVL
ncbi:unnamed protein product [Fraxinus pennsylvanica]|uniref:Tubby-like F-box protein 3 n=1 Tax=Fraxinus pennsylvanica TaxID=56036 RepID=A0AAD1ZJP9_9LAMI|nr:unnamed protein product [Fraxinus pennsylvanica]